MTSKESTESTQNNPEIEDVNSRTKPEDSQYAHWDYYARQTKRDGEFWPGDEWGNTATWERVFKTLFVANDVASWNRCVEIGPGAGKYTIRVLNESPAEIIAADISAGYQEHFRARLTEVGLISRVTPVLIDNNSTTLRRNIDSKGWTGTLDAFYSIDAMVHVDLQYLITYMVTAAYSLKVGGKLIMTVANCCSDRGFDKLISDAKQIFRRIHTHSAKFEWMSPDQLRSILPRLGFEIDVLDSTQGRDILFSATLKQKLEHESILKCIV